ncbi:MAG: TIM-barrel domain-containing protein [Solirubrobacteraceae bacterium]
MAGEVRFQNDPVDPSAEFGNQSNHYFVPEGVVSFDPAHGAGELQWQRLALLQRVSYHQVTLQFEDFQHWKDFPEEEYEDEQAFPFALEFHGPRVVRIVVAAQPGFDRRESPILERAEAGPVWNHEDDGERCVYRSEHGELEVTRDPWTIELRDADGRLLTRTNHHTASPSVVNTQPMPFCAARSSASFHRHLAASLALSPGESLYGCGESFTRLDKRGQRLALWTRDAYGAQSSLMYKPVPFYLSSRGYAAFVHTSDPLTVDLGHDYDGAAVLYLGGPVLDLFLFIGGPKQVVSDYTALTGRSRMPPRWSFGLWMGRDSYRSRDEVTAVARRLREERIPCDVLHVDTEWTEHKYRMDFELSSTRFADPERFLSELRDDGFRLSLWVFPYLHPQNPLHKEAIERDLVVLASNGRPPVDDAVLDFSNPDAVRWYQERLAGLLRQGVAVFTADFGEAAPFGGIYREDAAGFREHNLYPLRYAAAVAEVTHEITGDWIQHARAAWAGSQRYPLHFSGDPETSDGGMFGTLRGGLSLGLCGFSFWTHFVGGFPKPPDPELYLRWFAFGALCSHVRCHGSPPREPWEFGADFVARFRRIAELRYALIPYLLREGEAACAAGHPLLRPLFFEYPGDPGSWLVEDEYLLGPDLLVAPLFEDVAERDVYLPPGAWHGFFGGGPYDGPGWETLPAREVPVVLLVRDDASIPLAHPAQHTGEIDWERVREWSAP